MCMCGLGTTKAMADRSFPVSWLLRNMQRKQEMLSGSGSILCIEYTLTNAHTHTVTIAETHTLTNAKYSLAILLR